MFLQGIHFHYLSPTSSSVRGASPEFVKTESQLHHHLLILLLRYAPHLADTHGDAKLGPEDKEGARGYGSRQLAVSELVLHKRACGACRRREARALTAKPTARTIRPVQYSQLTTPEARILQHRIQDHQPTRHIYIKTKSATNL